MFPQFRHTTERFGGTDYDVQVSERWATVDSSASGANVNGRRFYSHLTSDEASAPILSCKRIMTMSPESKFHLVTRLTLFVTKTIIVFKF